ncbi:hypothetical protein BU23DRAFT_106448 [Bimuria novae-zelandiae CBS 107.79]|uniref:Uncharacterized protein n=1 Tax=Bimuria novae-zelandiae CBS 107.79 TaxID=1447943 RepID=A0A6A5W2X3_9PLEO|nr:hypothetical protein BU23DRAFT_106448 [Bimuria novae-zelandiae CBS 107.79]
MEKKYIFVIRRNDLRFTLRAWRRLAAFLIRRILRAAPKLFLHYVFTGPFLHRSLHQSRLVIIPTPSWAASLALAAVLVTAPSAIAQLSKTGNITLFSDTSCAEPVYVNSWTLGRDVCGAVDNSASSPTDVVF